jgi:FlaG/FlaF family flagellin (archaellin)
MTHGRKMILERRTRAVSDMVATLLIVAITIVLAAVLYVAISSWTNSTGSAPLGSEFAWGSPANVTSTTTDGCAGTTHYCYSIDMVVTGTDVPLARISLYLQTTTNIPVGWPTSVTATGGTLELIAPGSGSMAGRYWPLNSTWQTVSPFSGVVTSGYTLVIYCGGAAEGAHQGLAGLEIVAVGSSGYSGTVTSGAFS